MYLNTLDVKLITREENDSYNVKVNESTLEILGLISEFKIATGWHISRFLSGKDYSKYLYKKIRLMWKAGMLESFKVYSGSLAGIPVYYMLSKDGLKILEERGRYTAEELRLYPQAKQLLSWGLFKHEAQIIELGSLEVKNRSDSLDIKIRGETSSLALDYMSNKNIEVFTPDYTAWYETTDLKECIYTEFERTLKSKEAILKKIERYINFLGSNAAGNKTLRLIFQNLNMEESFWLNIISNGSPYLQKLRIITTNLSLIDGHESFLGEIYLSDKTVKLIKSGKLKVDTSQRSKLFASN